ncbi:MAG: hypothetical protein FJ144_06390 [Deltaproteobacteria bacterium]|nr:hypothetical protein [Deltaproteobacteria bacterium]
MTAARTRIARGTILLPVLLALALPEAGAQPIVYPSKGQSAQQQSKDEGECYGWAKGQTGVDPVALAGAPAATPAQQRGQRVRGAARGAAAGSVGGAIAGDAGTGAASGAAVGAMAGGMRKRREQREAKAQAGQAQQQNQAALEKYNRAYAACLEGRGYTVK